eukprot:13784780-Ditylum_brightwellii.AAC.1
MTCRTLNWGDCLGEGVGMGISGSGICLVTVGLGSSFGMRCAWVGYLCGRTSCVWSCFGLVGLDEVVTA